MSSDISTVFTDGVTLGDEQLVDSDDDPGHPPDALLPPGNEPDPLTGDIRPLDPTPLDDESTRDEDVARAIEAILDVTESDKGRNAACKAHGLGGEIPPFSGAQDGAARADATADLPADFDREPDEKTAAVNRSSSNEDWIASQIRETEWIRRRRELDVRIVAKASRNLLRIAMYFARLLHEMQLRNFSTREFQEKSEELTGLKPTESRRLANYHTFARQALRQSDAQAAHFASMGKPYEVKSWQHWYNTLKHPTEEQITRDRAQVAKKSALASANAEVPLVGDLPPPTAANEQATTDRLAAECNDFEEKLRLAKAKVKAQAATIKGLKATIMKYEAKYGKLT
jgi:hypothetical protein